jgi:CheY-like chemotaxis protein/HPt (histidine-containing phosphotransfer) domain-containing protein
MPSHEGPHVLVADDNEPNRILAAKQLGRLGCRAIVVEGGRSALEAMGNSAFALVLLDCQMPGMDGYEVTRTIREMERASADRARRVPIVAMTAAPTAQVRAACLEAGMDDFVAKPVTLKDLEAVLGRWIEGRTAGVRTSAAGPGGAGPTEDGPRFDVARLEGFRADLGEDAFARFRDAYLRELPERLRAVADAAGLGDLDAMARGAHMLKSSSAALGAMGLVRITEAIEAIDASASEPGAASLARRLELEGAAVADVLTRTGVDLPPQDPPSKR